MRFVSMIVLGACVSACSSQDTPPSDAGIDATTTDGTIGKDASKSDVALPDAGDGSCTTPIDCPDILGWVCDPKTKKCTPDQCGPESGKTCQQNQVCVFQVGSTTAAACYPRCERFTQNMPCAAMDEECVVGRADGSLAYCKARGMLATGKFCPLDSISTGCVAGHICAQDPQTRFCLEQCDFWGALKACTTDLCTPPGVCTQQPSDTAAIGAACKPSAAVDAPCGPSNGKLLGQCVGPKGAATCLAWCRLSTPSDCPMNQTCMAGAVPSVGFCQ